MVLAVGADAFEHVVYGQCGEAFGQCHLWCLYGVEAVYLVAAFAVEVCVQVVSVGCVVSVVAVVSAACLVACDASAVFYGVDYAVGLEQVEHARDT